jgi:hypothetical protein
VDADDEDDDDELDDDDDDVPDSVLRAVEDPVLLDRLSSSCFLLSFLFSSSFLCASSLQHTRYKI